MAGLQDIRRRIRSVKNTQQVTKAMKMISAVKLRKSQERLVAMRPFAGKLKAIVYRAVAGVKGQEDIPLGPVLTAFVRGREEKRIRVLLVASDKGLCGGFNATVLKRAQAFLDECVPEIAQLDVMGKRAADWARKRGFKGGTEYIGVPLTGLTKVAREIGSSVAQQYIDGEVDGLYVIYNHFHSAVDQKPTVLKIFPVEIPVEPLDHKAVVSHLLEPDAQTVLTEILPRYIDSELMRALLESAASEHGARMAAMDKASNNAGDAIAKLTLTMNKIRQASITNQIIEIVSGANA